MSLTRTDLSKMGVPEEFHSQIIAKHRDTVDEIKDERDRYKTEAEKVPGLEAERDSWKNKAEDGTAAARIEELEKQVQGFETEKLNGVKRTALTALLEKIGIDKRGFARVLAATDLDGVEMDGENIKDADKLAESLKTEWSDLLTEPGATGKPPQTPPQNPGNGGMTKEQIMAIKNRDERRVAIAQHLDLFQSNTKGE